MVRGKKKCLMKKKNIKSRRKSQNTNTPKTSTINRNLVPHRNVSQLREQKKTKTSWRNHQIFGVDLKL
jgi:hypothetical protein